MILFLSFLGGVILSAFCLLFLWRRRISLSPAEAALVLRSGTPSRIVFGDFVLMPFFERWERISLQEQHHSFGFRDEESIPTANGLKLNIEVDIVLNPPRDRKKIKRLLDEIGLEVFTNSEILKRELAPLINECLPRILKNKNAQDWINHERTDILRAIEKRCQQADIGFDIKSVFVSSLRSTDQEFYNPENNEDKKDLLSFQEETTSLAVVKEERARIIARKDELEEERKDLQHRLLELQSETNVLDKQYAIFQKHLEHIRQEIRVQIDLLKSHLDVELSAYRREAAQESSLLGKTPPSSVGRESAKLRNRHRIDADMLKREQEEEIDSIEDRVNQKKE